MTTGDAHGVIFNVDSVLRWGSLRRLLARLRALRTTSLRDRRSMLAMPRLVRAVSADLDNAPVFYLTAFPIVLAKPITTLLKRDGYPSGTLLTTGRSFTARWVVGGSRTRKLAGIEYLADRMPNVRWVLLGDDGGHDPQVFVDFAHRHRDRVAVIALRQVFDVDSPRINCRLGPGGAVGAAVVGAPNGEELLPLVRAASGSGSPARVRSRTGSSPSSNAAMGPPASGRGPRATRSVPLVHGRVYYDALGDVLAATGDGDSVQFVGWRGDADQLLADGGPTVVEALTGAAVAGRGCVGCCGTRTPTWWARRWVRTGCSPSPSTGRAERCCWTNGCSRSVATTRRWSSSAMPAVPRTTWRSSVASTSTTAAATTPITMAIGRAWEPIPSTDPTRPTTTCSCALQGPVVREAEETFRERWHNPAPVTRLPWHVDPGPDPRPSTDAPRRFPRPYPTHRPPVPARSSSCGPTRAVDLVTPTPRGGNAASPWPTPRRSAGPSS